MLLESHLTQEIHKARIGTQIVKYWFHANEGDFGIARFEGFLQPDYGLITITYCSAVDGDVVGIGRLFACCPFIQLDAFSAKPNWPVLFKGRLQGCEAFGRSAAGFFRQQDFLAGQPILALRGVEVRQKNVKYGNLRVEINRAARFAESCVILSFVVRTKYRGG